MRRTVIFIFLAALAGMIGGGGVFGQEPVHPELRITVRDGQSFKLIEYVNVSIVCGPKGFQCQGAAGCVEDRDWVNPRFGWYRAITGSLYLAKVGLDSLNVLSYRPEAEGVYYQDVCMKVWKDGYEPLIVEKAIKPGLNTYDLFLKPVKKKAGDSDKPAAGDKPSILDMDPE